MYKKIETHRYYDPEDTKAVIERILMANSGPQDYNYSGI